MRKFALALALIFSFGIALDSFEVDCVDAAGEDSCHVCVCANPGVASGAGPLVGIRREPQTYLAYVRLFSSRLTDKTLLQPPKAA